ncbi:hypothetical protein M569_00616, partial [Genlisea aurea]
NIMRETPNLVKLLIGKDTICAKYYLKDLIHEDIYNKYISILGEYTLEAIMIYVLGIAFNSIQESSIVKMSTLIELLEKTVRTQANIQMKKDSICNFDLRLLPLQLNLPMVCKPLDWEYPHYPEDLGGMSDTLISLAKGASDPFQFIAKVICKDNLDFYHPISQDASASAYQIMSYFLLNEEMARRTNLIQNSDGKIQDIYTNILSDFKISYFCSLMDQPVKYSTPYLITKQDYMSIKKEYISVYEKMTKKRRRVTINIPTDKRDIRKTQTSTCANFIHQKDAYIAMKVVESLLRQGVPIYTVHDNFITTPAYAKRVTDIYTKIFIQMGHPLNIINQFIKINLI